MAKLRTIYTYVIVLSCVLSLYYSFIPKLMLTEFTLILCLLYAFVVSIKDKRIYYDLSTLLLLLMIACNLIIQTMLVETQQLSNLVGTTLRYLFDITLLCFMSQKFFDFKLGCKIIKHLSIITTSYIIIQFILNAAIGLKLPGGLPYLNIAREDTRNYIEGVVKWGLTYRPRSLFAEPAHYCQFTLMPLVLLLFCESQVPAKDSGLAVFHTIGIICSMSLLGILSAYFVWVLYWWRIRNNSNIFLLAMIILPIVSIILVNTPIIQSTVLNRLFSDELFFTDYRLQSNEFAFDKSISVFNFLFGHGMIDAGFYLTSYPRWFYCFGFVGIITLIAYMIHNLRTHFGVSHTLIVVFLVVCLGTEMLLGASFKVWFSFVLSKKVDILHQCPRIDN